MLSLRPDLLFCPGYHLDAGTYRNYRTLSRVKPVVDAILIWAHDRRCARRRPLCSSGASAIRVRSPGLAAPDSR
jgi:hypothetical protein